MAGAALFQLLAHSAFYRLHGWLNAANTLVLFLLTTTLSYTMSSHMYVLWIVLPKLFHHKLNLAKQTVLPSGGLLMSVIIYHNGKATCCLPHTSCGALTRLARNNLRCLWSFDPVPMSSSGSYDPWKLILWAGFTMQHKRKMTSQGPPLRIPY